MDKTILENKIKARGRDFFDSIKGETPSIFDKGWWAGKVLDWAMRDENFKVQLFRFVDVLPCLATDESLVRHMQEYFAGQGQEAPAVLKWGAKTAGCGKFTARLAANTIRHNLEAMARLFVIGRDQEEAGKTLAGLRRDNFAFTVDILGEATVSEAEELIYQQNYLDLLELLASKQQAWKSLGNHDDGPDWGHAPRINIAIKPSTLFSQAQATDFEGSVTGICQRLLPILRKAQAVQAFVCIDMEQRRYKDITLEVYRRLRSSEEFKDFPHFGVAFQSYLRETDADLDTMIAWARQTKLPISIRLVKGAYWDYETVTARQNGWPQPVYAIKAESDAAFERHAKKILENHELCHLACASHNVRSIAAVLEMAEALKAPAERYEFQVLFGMAEPVRKGLQKVAGRVRLYCPFGELLPGMAYLVRRLLENTSNESFLRKSFVETTNRDSLLEDPLATISRNRERAANGQTAAHAQNDFQNQAAADFTSLDLRQDFIKNIAAVRQECGRRYPLLINGKAVETGDLLASVNPADPAEIIGQVCQAGVDEIGMAIIAAKEASQKWRKTPAKQRAEYLFSAAAKLRSQIVYHSAWQVLEAGKQWSQAHADVCEAIDFLEYYGREMMRLSEPRLMGQTPGEANHYFYQPRGLAAVIAPWNFPLAISCGMCAAALVTGNCVLFKPSGLASVVGAKLAELFREAGLPPGIFNFVPGRGSLIGDFLVSHPDINIIAFTGSEEVGLHIAGQAGRMHPGQNSVKKVIAEMGGKNAIIVDDDADIDEAVAAIINSAFGYQGQKCSACSRVIIHARIYDTVVNRLVEAAKSIRIGPAEEPANFMGPVIDAKAQEKIRQYIEIGRREGTMLLQRPVPSSGYYVPLTIFADIRPEHRLAQEEIFGPVLAIMKAASFEEALTIANSTAYALTGGVFSRSPHHLQLAREEFRVGNLYLNRGITGALVERQPFGGFKRSGIGSKAGGPDYLLQFMEPRTITENTMRRGFVPNS